MPARASIPIFGGVNSGMRGHERALRMLLVATPLVATACASLGGIEQAPDRKTAAALLVEALTCQSSDPQKPCDPALQPKEVRFSEFDCEKLPLRSGVNEAAHAVCGFAGEVVRVNGVVEPLAETAREFSLIDLTPGMRVPKRKWTLGKAR